MAQYTKHEAREWAWEHLRGQWTTLITPFTADDAVDEAGLRSNIAYIRSLGARGGGCTWGMGEFWSLSFDERKRVMEVTADAAGGKWGIAAHVTHTSIRQVHALAKHAEALNFDLLIIAAPYMVTKTEDQVVDFVRHAADRTNLAIMFYNSPQFGIVMSPQGLKRLCAIPNVVGVKEASFSQQTSIETHLLLGKQSIISTPDEWIFAKGKELGFQQRVMFANTSDWRFDLPGANHYVQFVERACQGDLDQPFYDKYLKAIKAVSDQWWGRTVKKFNGALPVPMVKAWAELMGMKAGHTRPPLADLTPEEKAELRRDVSALRPIASPVGASAARPSSPRPSMVVGGIPALDQRTATIVGPRNGSSTVRPEPAEGRAHATALPGSGMMLMVSVQNMQEALEADKGGADIIDVKNLQEALVGSGHPMLVEEVRRAIKEPKHVSVTLGVVPNQAGTVAMAVYAAAQLNATSVKVGFVQADYETALQILKDSKSALKGSATKLIGSLFADNHLYSGLDPLLMPRLARESECDGWLIDTLTKDGRNLFDFIPEAKLKDMVMDGKSQGMSTALSGHLRMTDVNELARINPDIVGVRGAVCATGDRNRTVAWEAVAAFKRELDLRKSGALDPRAVQQVRPEPVEGRADVSINPSGWVIVDGRGKNCAGVIAAISKQADTDRQSLIEAILADALNIYDVILWTRKSGHRLITQRKDDDGTVRVLIQPFAGVPAK